MTDDDDITQSTNNSDSKKHVSFADTKLTSLPGNVDYSQVESLDLSHNPLSLTDDDFDRLAGVMILNLTATRLKSLPNGIMRLKSLKALYVDQNNLRTLPNAFSKMDSIRTLSLEGNQFERFPKQIYNLPLQDLNLSHNRITEIPAEVALLTELRSLVLGTEKGRSTSARRGMIARAPVELGELSQLRKLILSNNRLAELPATLGNLELLELLEASNNQLIELPAELAPLVSRGLLLRVDGNPLREPLPDVIDRGPKALATYLASLTDAVEQYEAKLLMVGEGNVGKTSLVQRLLGKPFVTNRPTTHGIEVSHLTVPHPRLPITLTLHIWDFGGQEVYRISHQFFFSRRALYVVTWNPRQGQEQDEVEGWLRRIRLRVGHGVRILVVATHADERNPELDYPLLKAIFGDILVGQYAVDTKTDTGLELLSSALAGQAALLPQMGQRLSSRWITARDRVLQLAASAPQISFESFTKLCADCGITSMEVRPLLELLHDLGHVIYYGSDEGLKEMVVLNPEWLTKAIGAVLEDRGTRASSGVLSHARLREIWKVSPDGGYETKYHPYFLRLMEKFDVSYRLDDDEGKSLVAQLVPYERPDVPWDRGQPHQEGVRVLGLICETSEAAPGLIAWLTVRHHRSSTGRHWRRGVFLRHAIDLYASEALLELIDERRLAVEVRAPSPDLFFNVIRDSIEDLIVRRWPGISYTLFIPCPTVRNGVLCSGRLKLDALIRLREKQRAEIVCQECTEDHDIGKLLTGFDAASYPFQEKLQDLTSQLGGIESGIHRLELYASESADSLRKMLKAVSAEAADCPRLFTLGTPGRFEKRKSRFWESRLLLTLWCEHADAWHPCEAGDYQITEPRDWLRNIAPYAYLVVKTLQAVVPVAGAGAGMVMHPETYRRSERRLEVMEAIVTALPGSGRWKNQLELPLQDVGQLTYLEAGGLRAFRTLLFKLDPYQRFGGLRRVQDPSGEFLWVCNEHYGEYDPGLPALHGDVQNSDAHAAE